jgi:hypothetical protein
MFLPRLRPYVGRPSGRTVVHITNPTPKEVPSRVSWQILSVAMEAPKEDKNGEIVHQNKGSIRFIGKKGDSVLQSWAFSVGFFNYVTTTGRIWENHP